MKTTITAILVFAVCTYQAISQDYDPQAEIFIGNLTANSIYVRFYPVGTLFNGDPRQLGNDTTSYDIRKTVSGIVPRRNSPVDIGHIIGLDGIGISFPNANFGFFRLPTFNGVASEWNNYLLMANDQSSVVRVDCMFSYGKYVLEIFDSSYNFIISIPMDNSDFDYPYPSNGVPSNTRMCNDLYIYINNINTSPPGITYRWDACYQVPGSPGDTLSLFDPVTTNGEIHFFQQFYSYRNPILKLQNRGKSFAARDSGLLDFPIRSNNINLFGQFANEIHLNPGDLNGNLTIRSSQQINIKSGETFRVTNLCTLTVNPRVNQPDPLTKINVESGARLIVAESSTLSLKSYANVVILQGGRTVLEQNSNVFFHERGEIIVKNGGNLINCGANFTNNNYACILVESGGYYGTGEECNNSVVHTVDSGAFIVVDGGTVRLSNGSKLIFNGSDSYLDIRPNSTMLFGDSSGIEFRNGAYIKANGAEFRVANSSSAWSGINFSNSGHDSIVNCTFSNAKTALSFINDEQHKFTNRIIKNCTFNIPTGGDYKGIYGENNYSILVEGNRFNMPVPPPVDAPFYTGVYLKNVTPSSPPETAGEEGATATPYSLNIVNNTFRNGSSGIVLANYTSNLLPYYIKGNRFDSLDAHAAMTNILGMNVTGTFKDNVLSSSLTPIGIHLISSSPNLLNNIVNARDVALHLVGSSYANLAPNIYNNQSYWSGGRNTLSSFLYDNIQLAYMGNAYTDYGRNKFTVSNDSAYHIYGWLDTNVLRYHSRDNCWYTSGAAKIYLRHPGATMPVLSTIYNRGIDCNSSPAPISWEVDNLGNGIFDSVLVSNDVSDSIPTEEEILIAQCEYYLNEMQMFGEAMISLKYYIDDYPEGEYTNDALMNLYTAYLYLDTSANQNNRNILFGNLINYCEDKVASNLYDTQFEYLAGDVIAMCNFELDNYDDAMNWYEFIALFYPDPDVRLSASWNYEEIEALIGSGTGGGEVELGIKNYELGMKRNHEKLELNRLFKAAQDDPVMRKLFRKFELQNRNVSEIDMQATNGNKQHEAESDVQNNKLSEADMLICDKAKKNIFSAGTLQGKEAESDRMRDVVLMLPGARGLGKIVPSNVLPAEFALRQNYPNPFNPVTNIEYDLPVDGNIELKIYDIAGRLIKTLVNEFKTAGSYLVSFNASDLSSGVYFYSMNVDRKQIAVKRMALVK